MSAAAAHAVELYGPGGLPASYIRGSMFLTSGMSFVSRAIQLVQRLWSPACYARLNLGGPIAHEHRKTVESSELGPEVEHMEKYRETWVVIIPDIHPHDLEQLRPTSKAS